MNQWRQTLRSFFRELRPRRLRIWLGALAATTLPACTVLLPKAVDPMPTQWVNAPAPGPVRRLAIVLPGRGDDLAALANAGIAAAIQRSRPDFDVVLVEATLSYYMDGGLVARLHNQIVTPARQRGYREIWLAGASMGGVGVTLYEHEHPGELTGLLLMAPFMGEESLIKEIAAAGGGATWEPGPKPVEINRANSAREQWRVVKSWSSDNAMSQRVWLVCGESDRLRPAADLIGAVLPPGHYLAPVGGHAWKVWSPGAEEIFARMSRGAVRKMALQQRR
jgi:pimeloyl-ACP methyl ester carboxylesterase